MSETDDRGYYTVQEVAKELMVSKKTVHNWIDEGKLEAFKMGKVVRIPVDAFRKFVSSGKTEAPLARASH